MWGEKKKKENDVEEDHYTFLGKGVDFKGKASFDGTVRIDGRFEGEITTGDTLIIGESAVIKGSITGGVIVSSGKVEGNVLASERVELLNNAVLIGDYRRDLRRKILTSPFPRGSYGGSARNSD